MTTTLLMCWRYQMQDAKLRRPSINPAAERSSRVQRCASFIRRRLTLRRPHGR